mmetsp:Transcript_41149/g.74002  ORF Transcript_41149/g.74002 Transcript_41149/m.74002 type:complete len:638 (-) Transcript_41149:1944-3857(-)
MFATTRAGGAVLPGTVSAVMYPASNCVRAARPVRRPTRTRLPCVPGSSTELRCFNSRSPSLPRQPRGCSLRAVPIESVVDLTAAGLDGLLAHLPHHLPNHLTLLYERVTLPCSSQNCGDMVYRSTLDPVLRMEQKGINPQGVALLGLLGAYLATPPGVLEGAFDYYVAAPLQREFADRVYGKDDFKVGKKMAEGGFGSVFRGTLRSRDEMEGAEVIIKKASEFGEAEVWMNERLSRAAPGAIADFLTAFSEDSSSEELEDYGTGLLNSVLKTKPVKKQKKQQGPIPLWLVWEYEGSETLYTLMAKRDFPYNMEQALLGRELNIEKGTSRKLIMYKIIAQQVLESLAAIHRTGIVHRDVKPQNILVSEKECRLKFIDFGAAADLRVGINYVPNEFLLDPRFAPPQQYIMSTQTPRAPPLPVAAFLSPVLWNLNIPDRFDMYSVGITLLQVCLPPLRSDNAIMVFNKKLESYDFNLRKWRAAEEANFNREMQDAMSVLDADGGQLWSLLTKLVVFKPEERLSATKALTHPALGKSGIMSSLTDVASELGKAASTALDTDWVVEQIAGKGNGLTEADIADMGLDKKKPAGTLKASNTIAWWQGRQNALEQKQAERRKKLRDQLVQTIRNRATETIAGKSR